VQGTGFSEANDTVDYQEVLQLVLIVRSNYRSLLFVQQGIKPCLIGLGRLEGYHLFRVHASHKIGDFIVHIAIGDHVDFFLQK
jgi:hypothetical protein